MKKKNIYIYIVLRKYISDDNLKSKLWQNQTTICDESQNFIKPNHSNYNNNKKLKSLCPQNHESDKTKTKMVTRLENLTCE